MSMKIVFTAAAALVVLGGPGFAATGGQGHSKARAGHHAERTVARSSAYGAGFGNGARAAVGRSYVFEGWPTDYLTNRFGDHQEQGR